MIPPILDLIKNWSFGGGKIIDLFYKIVLDLIGILKILSMFEKPIF